MFVLGAGSLGCLWAGRLAARSPKSFHVQENVTLLLRCGSKKSQALQSGSNARIRITPSSKENVEAFEVDVRAEEVTASGDIQKLLLVTKAAAAAEALLQVSPRLKAGAVVVLLCNGALALHEQINEMPAVRHSYLMLGLTTHGAWSKADFDIVHAGVGHTSFGKYQSSIPEALYQSTLQHLQSAGLGGTDDPRIERSLWLKLAANAAINPITALLEKPNGFILETETQEQITQVCREVAAVADAVWKEKGFESVCPSAVDMKEFATETARQTANNRSSMLQDILAQRPTEIDYINGWVVQKADFFGIDVPENARLTSLVKQKESQQEEKAVMPCHWLLAKTKFVRHWDRFVCWFIA